MVEGRNDKRNKPGSAGSKSAGDAVADITEFFDRFQYAATKAKRHHFRRTERARNRHWPDADMASDVAEGDPLTIWRGGIALRIRHSWLERARRNEAETRVNIRLF